MEAPTKHNRRLKNGLVLQSLSPVFFLLFIRHFPCEYWSSLFPPKDYEELNNAWIWGRLFVFVLSFLWIFVSGLYIFVLSSVHTAGFMSKGERINKITELKNAPMSFVMTFVLPLLIDDLSTLQSSIAYLFVIVIVCRVVAKTNLYYQSPVLSLLGYRVYTFNSMSNSSKSGYLPKSDVECIGITFGYLPSDANVIKWKKISDNVYLIYEEKRKGSHGL